MEVPGQTPEPLKLPAESVTPAPILETLNAPFEKIKEMSPEEYSEYLKLLSHFGSGKLAASRLDVITERFKKDLINLEDKPYPGRYVAHYIGQETRLIIWHIAGDPDISVDPDIIQKLYKLTKSKSRTIRFHAIQYIDNLIILDNRNHKRGERVGIFEQFMGDLTEKLVSQEQNDQESALWMTDVVWASFPNKLGAALINAVRASETRVQIRTAFSMLANRIGLEKARKILKEEANNDPGFAVKLEFIEKSLSLAGDENTKFYSDLRKLYDEIKFEEYAPNTQLQEFEARLLRKQMKKSKKILDVGQGPVGRHMEVLQKIGKGVVGFDLVEKHSRLAKSKNPNLNVLTANWYNTPFLSGTFDSAYCLGRSFTHNTTVDDAIDFLRETRRILRPNGFIIIDTPLDTKGFYAQERKRLSGAAERLGIDYKETATIIDSPDGHRLFDRLIPSKRQFIAMANLAGFSAKLISKHVFTGIEGNKNINLYWRLAIRKRPLKADGLLKYIHDSHTGSPPLFVTWI